MSTTIKRTFSDSPAVRGQVPLAVGLFGPSGSGKTNSALRLAAGIQRIVGGDTYFIDTEANRALHYADKFNFRHVPFVADFSPLDYLAAIEHCVKKGAKTIIIDSMSHEHEGPGGVLEMHEAEHKRLGGSNGTKMLAWAKPKQERRRLIGTIVQTPCNFILCFRAKEKLKIVRGADPEPLGFMPIGGEEFIYEMTAAALLMPGAYGIPTWQSRELGEAMMIKRPEQFHALFAEHGGKPISEAMGEAMAKWACGDSVSEAFMALQASIAGATTVARLDEVGQAAKDAARKKAVTPAEYRSLGEAGTARRAALVQRPPSDPPAEMSPAGRQPGED
jgi:hypothetical protein